MNTNTESNRKVFLAVIEYLQRCNCDIHLVPTSRREAEKYLRQLNTSFLKANVKTFAKLIVMPAVSASIRPTIPNVIPFPKICFDIPREQYRVLIINEDPEDIPTEEALLQLILDLIIMPSLDDKHYYYQHIEATNDLLVSRGFPFVFVTYQNAPHYIQRVAT